MRIFLLLLFLSVLVFADYLDDEFDSFDDEETFVIETKASVIEESWYDFAGSLSFLGAYNYAQDSENAAAPGDKVMDFSGLSRARTSLNLAVDMKHSQNWKSRIEVLAWYDASWIINDKDSYTTDVLDTYESFYDLKEAYIQGTLSSSLDIKVGRQVVIWGKSDSIRITDVINPLDVREPGMVDIEDLRLSEAITKLDYYFGSYSLSALIIHEPRLQIEPAFGSDYRPRDVFGVTAPDSAFPDVQELSFGGGNTQYALSLDGHFEGWDMSIYLANVLNSRFSITKDNNGNNLRSFEKIKMAGFATNIVSGAWLYKAEAAFISDINYRSVSDNKDRLDALVGVDYSGLSKTVLSLELAQRHVFKYEDIMLQNTLAQSSPVFPDYEREDAITLALRGSYLFDHDNASVNYLISMFGSQDFSFEDGGFQRFWVTYKYNDNVNLNTGFVDYIGGNGEVPFYNAIKNNDRVFAEISYVF